MMVFIATFAAQWGIGEIIDLWPQIGEGRYDPEAQQTAMVVMIGLQLAGFAWFAWPRPRPRPGGRLDNRRRAPPKPGASQMRRNA